MRMTPDEALQLAQRAVEVTMSTGAEHAEALVSASDVSLSRFADNRIHQNVTSADGGVSVRAVVGKRVGVASTNRVDPASLSDCCAEAVSAANHSPEDPDFPGLPEPRPVETPDRTAAATLSFGPAERAEAVSAIIAPSASRGFSAAGTVGVSAAVVAVANSLGVGVAMPTSLCRMTVLSTGKDGGTGWSSRNVRDASTLDPAALGEAAASIANRSADPRDLEPGVYTVVLGPEAAVEIVQYLSWFEFSAKAVEEGRSFMTGHIGEKLMDASVTIVDDAQAADAMGLTFDFEGMPKKRVAMIDAGVAAAVVTDSYWAAKTGQPNTGHALPAPNAFGPLPLNVRMEPGTATLNELISKVEKGVYVTRFHYVNVEDPVSATLTGMTRDGTFAIRDGEIAHAVKNQRFTQSAVEALAHVGGISAERWPVGEGDEAGGGGALVPYLLLERYAFTGQTG